MYNYIIPKIFQIKNKTYGYNLYRKSKIYKGELISSVNRQFGPKHYPPYVIEWINSVYFYNKNIVKCLPSLDINAYNLIKSYFNLYVVKHNKKMKSKRWRIKNKKYSTRRLMTSKPSLRHTNDIINITIYAYDRNSIYYKSKIIDLLTIDQIKNKKNYLIFLKNLKKKYSLLEHKIKRFFNTKYLRDIIINKYKPFISNNKKINKAFINLKINSIIKNRDNISHQILNNFIKKTMRAEIASINYKQCICFEQSKYEEQHLQLLTMLLENFYNKKIVLDIVNLKYFYNNSNIFSSSLLTKLKIKKNKTTSILGSSLHTFDILPLDRKKIYNEMYNKKNFKQNTYLKDLTINNNLISQKFNADFQDLMDASLYKDSNRYNFITSIDKMKESELNLFDINLNKVIDSLKNKFTKGIRIQVAGRLTKRNTAERSVYKMRYKGNLKNLDSSTKKLSSVLLRGHAKSNLIYTQSKSKLRIGAFGLKTWVSSD